MVLSIRATGRKGEDPEVFADGYLKEYEEFIFKQPEMEIEDIIGEDVEAMVQRLKETVGGLDQWGPADLKLLSKEACNSLAGMFNMIEKGASWPKQLRIARAAFLAKKRIQIWTRWITGYY